MSQTDGGLSSAQIHKQIDASLQRLAPIMSISISAIAMTRIALEETMAALTDVVR